MSKITTNDSDWHRMLYSCAHTGNSGRQRVNRLERRLAAVAIEHVTTMPRKFRSGRDVILGYIPLGGYYSTAIARLNDWSVCVY